MPKTIRNKYDEKLTYDNLMKAHLESRKNKSTKKDIILFNLKQEEYIRYLYDELKNQTYKHGGYYIFYIREPKLRKIQKSKYIDRIVHRWVVDSFLYDAFVPQFLTTSYACIKYKGMHKACLDVQNAMRHCKNIWNNYYILKMDVRKYFQSINKTKLLEIISRKIKDKKILWVLKEIIFSEEGETGIAIGNYTSQIFANIYLNEVDQYIKHKLKVKYYYRYMDDSIILVKTKEEAKYILEKITNFLKDELYLELNEKTQVFKSKQGVNFCGYKINEYRIKIRDKGKKRLKNKIIDLKLKIKNGEITSKEAQKYICRHMGYIKYANIYNLCNKLFYIKDEFN
ncbi:MAG: RNA-dependent DNA polymerase [Clostridia bacterium]|nr:RNA-dependent DNA polymerase [Clostridia bacterium]